MHPFHAEDKDATFMYGGVVENESTFMVSSEVASQVKLSPSFHLLCPPSLTQSEEPETAEMGTPEPFSTGTSLLSSLPNIPHSYREEDEEEEEESVRTYAMGPVLRVSRHTHTSTHKHTHTHTNSA